MSAPEPPKELDAIADVILAYRPKTIDTVGREISARIWEGQTDTGVPVKAWIAVVQPQTDDPALLEAFERWLNEVPVARELVSFDLRML